MELEKNPCQEEGRLKPESDFDSCRLLSVMSMQGPLAAPLTARDPKRLHGKNHAVSLLLCFLRFKPKRDDFHIPACH